MRVYLAMLVVTIIAIAIIGLSVYAIYLRDTREATKRGTDD